MLPPEGQKAGKSLELTSAVPTKFQRCSRDRATSNSSTEKLKEECCCLFCPCHSSRKGKASHSFGKKWIAVRKSPSLLSLLLSPTSSSLQEQTGISLSETALSPRACQDPGTCDFQQVFSSRRTNLLAANTHLKELAGVPVSRLKKSDIWQVIPQRSRTGRVSGSLVSLFPNCTGDKVCASWMTNSPACPTWSFSLGFSSALKRAPVKHRTCYSEILR